MRILIAEDDPLSVELFTRILGPLQSEVKGTPSLKQAIHLCEVSQWDVIVLDLRLIDAAIETTINAIPVIRARQKHTPILVISGYPDPKYRDLALANGATGFMCKKDAYSVESRALFMALLASSMHRTDPRAKEPDFMAAVERLEHLAGKNETLYRL